MRRAFALAFGLVCASFAGCLDAGDGQPPGGGPTPGVTPTTVTRAPSVAGPVQFRDLGSGGMAGTHEEAREVFTDTASFVAFWDSVRQEDEPAPDVDFNLSTVAAAVAGPQANACWSLRITNATDDGAGATSVQVTTYSPPVGMMCAQVVTFPWHIVALDGAMRDVRFAERVEPGPPPEE